MSVTKETTEQKLVKYDEFFSISHQFNVNILPLKPEQGLNYQDFIASMPTPFKMANDIATIDQSALRSLQGLSDVASKLASFLNHQSEKINLLMGYILSQQDDAQYRYKGIAFGGGGLLFVADTAFAVSQLLELKIFLLNENSAVYCYGEVIEVTQKPDHYQHKVIFHFIREDDREILVRSSLHEQSKQLQQLAKQRNKESKS